MSLTESKMNVICSFYVLIVCFYLLNLYYIYIYMNCEFLKMAFSQYFQHVCGFILKILYIISLINI